MDVMGKMVELLEPHMSSLACEYESGSCELTSCRSCNARNIADHLISNGVTVQEWISVKDRLPRKEEYTATTEYGTEYYIRLLIAYKTDTVEYEIGYYDGYKWMTEMPIRLIKDVVAWMPFPNMPQPQKGE